MPLRALRQPFKRLGVHRRAAGRGTRPHRPQGFARPCAGWTDLRGIELSEVIQTDRQTDRQCCMVSFYVESIKASHGFREQTAIARGGVGVWRWVEGAQGTHSSRRETGSGDEPYSTVTMVKKIQGTPQGRGAGQGLLDEPQFV